MYLNFPMYVIGACPDGCVILGIATDCLLCLTTHCPGLSPTRGNCEKVDSDLGLSGGIWSDTPVS